MCLNQAAKNFILLNRKSIQASLKYLVAMFFSSTYLRKFQLQYVKRQGWSSDPRIKFIENTFLFSIESLNAIK